MFVIVPVFGDGTPPDRKSVAVERPTVSNPCPGGRGSIRPHHYPALAIILISPRERLIER